MKSVSRVGIAALALFALGFGAAVAQAQDEGDDTIKKKDNTTSVGKIESEDLNGCNVIVSKAKLTFGWKLIKSIDYGGSPEFKRAKGYADTGSFNDAIPLLEDLRKKGDLRPVLKPHVLNLLGASYKRAGDADQAIAVYSELFKQYPKCQFLVQGGGENLIHAYLAKNKAADADAALKLLFDGAKAAGIDTSPLNILKGQVQEATGDFASAAATYKQVFDSATDPSVKAQAELGIARCLFRQKKTAEAEAKYRSMVSRDVPPLVLAGAWNGLGDIMYETGRAKPDADLLTDALYAFLRGCVLYTPVSGEPTSEYEHALRGAHDCFKALSEIETNAERKKINANRAKERLDYLQTKFPGSPYIDGRK